MVLCDGIFDNLFWNLGEWVMVGSLVVVMFVGGVFFVCVYVFEFYWV